MFSWPPTRDTRNYQLLVICHAWSNVMSLNLLLKKRSKHNKKITKLCCNCEITDIKLLVLKKKGQNTTKSQSCVKIVKLLINKLLVFFFARQGLSGPYQILSSSSSDIDLIILVLRKKILIINIYNFYKILSDCLSAIYCRT